MERVRLKESGHSKTADTIGGLVIVPKTHTVLDRAMIAQFAHLAERGLPADAICDYLGINGGTFWTWVRKGEKYLLGNGEPKANAIYGIFVTSYRKALAEYRLRLVDSLHSPTSDKLWIRDLAVLERRDRKSFSRRGIDGGRDEDYDPDERFL